MTDWSKYKLGENLFVKAFKKVGREYKCRDFVYKEGETYRIEDESKVELCKYGFHACPSIRDLTYYYNLHNRAFALGLVTGKVVERDISKVVMSEITILLIHNNIADFIRYLIDHDLYNWERDSGCVAIFCPSKLDPNKYNWEEDSWAVAIYCPDNLDPQLFNWERNSREVTIYCPDKIDFYRFNWKRYGHYVVRYCPEKLLEAPKGSISWALHMIHDIVSEERIDIIEKHPELARLIKTDPTLWEFTCECHLRVADFIKEILLKEKEL